VIIGGQEVELVLVKNPAGFRLALASFDPADTSVMIAINDMYADGRDMSWLWDVDFSSLSRAASTWLPVSGPTIWHCACTTTMLAADAVEQDLKVRLMCS
jgi:UDP-N-acetylmuramyl tripeptide synthase